MNFPRWKGWKACVVVWILFAGGMAGLRAAGTNVVDPFSGDIFIHDPSTIVEDRGRYYVYGTAEGIRVLSSTNLLRWRREPAVLGTLPDWAKTVAPGFDGKVWAPDVIPVNHEYYLYYTISAWQKQTSAIGLAISASLDSSATNYGWKNGGIVIQSINGSPYNALDPSVMRDRDGSLWLAFGSYWKGIYLTQLDPKTGLRSTNSTLHNLAWHESIEASCLTRHEHYYYLFVDWGQCCRGTNSTYEIRVGRSESITGPYFDKMGANMANGGGSLFLGSEGRFIGPGHLGILDAKGRQWISFHTYDANFKGRSRLYIRQLNWSADDWPMAGPVMTR